MQPVTRDATTALLRAMRARLSPFEAVTFEEIKSKGWASATFVGARHEITMLLKGKEAEEAAGRFTTGLQDAEFNLRGHILADISLVAQERVTIENIIHIRLWIEALTVEDI